MITHNRKKQQASFHDAKNIRQRNKCTSNAVKTEQVTKYDGDNLSDCKNHALLQDSGDAVTVTFSTTNTDGWRGEFISLSFTNGHMYHCPIDTWIDYPDMVDMGPSSYVSTCAPLGTTKA